LQEENERLKKMFQNGMTPEMMTHEGGKPMNIVWQLQAPIPAKLIKKTNKLVVG